MTEYILYQVGVMVFYSSFQQINIILILPPISPFNSLMSVAEFEKIAIYEAKTY